MDFLVRICQVLDNMAHFKVVFPYFSYLIVEKSHTKPIAVHMQVVIAQTQQFEVRPSQTLLQAKVVKTQYYEGVLAAHLFND